jgi:hypothetical protein
MELEYGGARTFTSFTPMMFAEYECRDLSASRLPTANITGRVGTDIRGKLKMAGIPAGEFTFAVVADGTAGKGFGCIRTTITKGKETVARVTLTDAGVNRVYQGTYQLLNRFDFSGGLPDTVQSALHILDELTDDHAIHGNSTTDQWGQDPGAFITDIAMRQTCGWECSGGEGYDDCNDNHPLGDLKQVYNENFVSWSGAQSRFPGGCAAWEVAALHSQNWINDQIGTYVPEIVLRFLDTAGDLTRVITDARIQSELVLEPIDEFGRMRMTHRLKSMDVTLRGLDGDEHFYAFELKEVTTRGLEVTGYATVTESGMLELPEQTFPIGLGKLLQHIYKKGVLPIFGFENTAAMLKNWIDCEAVARALHGASDLLSVDTYEGACDGGLDMAGRLIESQLGNFAGSGSAMTVEGTATGVALTTKGLAQRLEPGEWRGAWDGDVSEIEGTFTGQLK